MNRNRDIGKGLIMPKWDCELHIKGDSGTNFRCDLQIYTMPNVNHL